MGEMLENIELHVKLRYLAGLLLIASAFTHNLQLLFVGFEWHDISAALVGTLYGIIGVLLILMKESKIISFIAIIFPVIGGALGLVRLFMIEIGIYGQINWFIVWHVIADAIIVPCCFYSHIKISNFDNNEILNFLSICLLLITGILHALQVNIYGTSFEILGQMAFGFVYIALSILIWLIGDKKIISILGFILPLIGGILGLAVLFIFPTPFLVVFEIIDLVVIIIRFKLYKNL